MGEQIKMPTEQITPRKVLQDLGYAPALRVPEPIQQPTPAVQKFGNQDLAQVNQLVNALGNFNTNISNFALGMRESQLKEQQNLIASDVNKLTQEYSQLKDKNNQTLSSYVEQGLISYGRLPEVRKNALIYMGKQKANELFGTAFTERADEVTRLENPANPDEVAADIYNKVMSGLGDNQYVRAGADEVFASFKTNFAVNAAQAKDKRFEYQTAQNTSAEVQGLVDRFSVAQTPEEQHGTLSELFKVQNSLRNSGVNEYKKLFSTSLSQAVTSLSVSDPEKAQHLITQLNDFPIKDEQGKVVGQFGRTTEERFLLAKLTQEADRAFDAKMAKQEQTFKAVQNELKTKGEEAVNTFLPEYIKAGKPVTSPELIKAVNESIAQQYGNLPASSQGAIFAAAMNRIHSVQSDIPVNPEVYKRALDSASRGDTEGYDSAVSLMSPEQQVVYNANREKLLSFGNITQSPAVSASLQQLNQALNRNLKVSETDPQDVQEQKLGIAITAAQEHKQKVFELIQTLRPEFKGTDEEFMNSREFLSGVNKITSDIQKEQLTKWETDQRINEAKAKESTPKSALSKLFPKVSVNSYVRPNSQQLFQNIKTTAESYYTAMDGVSFDAESFISDKKQLNSFRTMQQNIKSARAALPEIAHAARTGEQDGVALSPMDMRLANEAYSAMKKVVGYSSKELVRGVTNEGLPVNVEQMANTGEYLTVPLFQSFDSLQKEKSELQNLLVQYSQATDKAVKEDLKAAIQYNPLFTMLQKLNIDPLNHSPSNTKFFFVRQAKILKNLLPVSTPSADVSENVQSFSYTYY